MKIGIDARFYGPLGKGLGRYTAELIRSLESIDTENDYVVFLRRENYENYQPRNPRFRKVLADFQWYSFEEQFGLVRVLLREHCDLMHFPHFNVPILYRRPFVVTVHDLILLRFPTLRATTLGPFRYRMKFLAYRAVIRNALFRSGKIITVSEYTKRDILDRYRIPATKIAVTYEATHPLCFILSGEERRSLFRRLGLLGAPDDRLRPYALYVGNAYPHKNLTALLDAFHRFPDADARLVLVGGEDYFYRRLKKRAKSHGITAAIFAGAVSDPELDTLYRFSRVSVFPSLYEGFGLPPLEALAKGAPVLAARAAAFPEILAEAACFFDPGTPGALRDVLLRLWTHEEMRQACIRKGYARSALFSWERMGRQTLDEYREAVERGV